MPFGFAEAIATAASYLTGISSVQQVAILTLAASLVSSGIFLAAWVAPPVVV